MRPLYATLALGTITAGAINFFLDFGRLPAEDAAAAPAPSASAAQIMAGGFASPLPPGALIARQPLDAASEGPPPNYTQAGLAVACSAPRSSGSEQPAMLAARCMLVATNPDQPLAARRDAMRQAAEIAAQDDASLASWANLHRTVRLGDPAALVSFAEGIDPSSPSGGIAREALLLAESASVASASAALSHWRSPVLAAALEQPKVMLALAEGRAIEDSEAHRRYILGLLMGWQTGCPWQGTQMATASFAAATEQYAAPLTIHSQAQLATQAGKAVASTASATYSMLGKLADGQPYKEAGERWLVELSQARRGFNTIASRASAAGSRDSVRILAAIGGCQTPEYTRLLSTLQALMTAQAAKPLRPASGAASAAVGGAS